MSLCDMVPSPGVMLLKCFECSQINFSLNVYMFVSLLVELKRFKVLNELFCCVESLMNAEDFVLSVNLQPH